MFFIIIIVSFIFSPILPRIVIQPFSFIYPAIRPNILSFARNLKLFTLILPYYHATPHHRYSNPPTYKFLYPVSYPCNTCLAIKHKFTFIFALIIPLFDTKSMLQVIFPVTLIFGAIYVKIGTLKLKIKNYISIGLIELPLAFEYVTIYVIKFALPVSFIVQPFAFVSGSVGPFLNSVSVLEDIKNIVPSCCLSILRRRRHRF